MKPSYDPNQQGFDFGVGNLFEDVCTIIDMKEFPKVEPEDIANKLRCRGEYAIDVYRRCMAIWEDAVDMEIVEELRRLPNRDGMSIEMMAIVLGESEDSVSSDLEDAMDRLGLHLDILVKEIGVAA